MTSINPYLYFNGNCEEAFNFYKSVFQQELSSINRYKDAPKDQRNIFKESDEKIMHITLPLSSGSILFGSDNTVAYEELTQFNSFSLIIHTDNKEEVDRLFAELSENGQIKVPAGLTFWGAYYGECIDQFGVGWKIMLNSDS